MVMATGWCPNSNLIIHEAGFLSTRAPNEELSGVVVGILADQLYVVRRKFVLRTYPWARPHEGHSNRRFYVFVSGMCMRNC
jgi:hypothetical protein